MKREDMEIGKYYLVQSNTRLNGGRFIGKLIYDSGGIQVCLNPIDEKTRSVRYGKSWWTHRRFVLKEIPEHEAVLEMVKEW